MQTLVDEILAGNYDDIERSRKIWFLWPAGSHSPTDVQLSFINYEDTDHPNLLAGTGTCDWNMSEDDGLYAFTYTVDYVDMPSDGMLTLEYCSTYPTKDVAGDGTASFTIYAASDPGQLRVSASGTGIGNLAVMTASLSNTCPTASMDVTVDDCDTGIDNYLYDYTITPSGVPSGATITYSGPVSMTYAGEATIPVDNSPLTTLSASATLPNGYEIASDSATVTPDDTLMCGPSITVSGACRDDVYGTPVEYTFTAAGTNLFGGSIYKQGTTQTFPIIQTGPTITAVWSLDDRVYDEFTMEDAAALECTSSSLTASGTGCVLTDGGASLLYTYTVNYSGYVIGDDFWVDDTNDGIDNPRLVGEADVTGTFTFTSYEESVLITSVLGFVTATANTQLCPVPSIAIEGECVANEAGTGFVYNYAITYNDLVGGSSIAYTSGSNSIGSYTIPGTGSPLDGTDERNGLTFNTLTATWLYALADRSNHPTASATATVNPIVCPVLDLTLENTACKLEEDGGHVLNVWTVTNPGIRDVYFEWTSTRGASGNGTATFEPMDPETTSVTLAWDEVSASSPIIEEHKVEVIAVPDFPCEHEMEPPAILDPYCHLNENEEWQEIWKIQNLNNWALEVTYQVNGGGIQGPFEIPANSELAFALPLGENTVKAMWDSGKESISSTAYLSYEMCEGTPYNPPDVPDVPYIPGTGAEPVLEAPAAGGELLIPVTGADMSSPLVNAGFFYNLYTYIGLFFLGLGMVVQGIKNRLIH